MKSPFEKLSADRIRESLHHRLDLVPVPDLSDLTTRVMQAQEPSAPLTAPRRVRYVSLALAAGVVAAGIGYGLNPSNIHAAPRPTFIGTASALNLAVPYLTQHHVRAIHVPTFLPFTQVASFKTSGPRVVPIVRAGTGTVPRSLIHPPTTPRAVYWIAISSQDAPARIASNIGQRTTIAALDAMPHPWLLIAASRHPLLLGGTSLQQGALHYQLWNATQLQHSDGLSHQGSAITWKIGLLTYTILVQNQTVPPSELVWLARTMARTTLTKPEAFSLVYHALQANQSGAPTLSTWVFTAHPDSSPERPQYLTKVRWSSQLVRPMRGMPRKPGVSITLPKPALHVSIPVLLPHFWRAPAAGFYATVSSQFNPGGYSVSWTRTVAPVGTTTVDPMNTPFLTVTGGDLVSARPPRETLPAELPATYWTQLRAAAHTNTTVAAWVAIQGHAVWVHTAFNKNGPLTVLDVWHHGQLYQVTTGTPADAFPTLFQMFNHSQAQ